LLFMGGAVYILGVVVVEERDRPFSERCRSVGRPAVALISRFGRDRSGKRRAGGRRAGRAVTTGFHSSSPNDIVVVAVVERQFDMCACFIRILLRRGEPSRRDGRAPGTRRQEGTQQGALGRLVWRGGDGRRTYLYAKRSRKRSSYCVKGIYM
jgi:hypothetical protein